MKTHDDIRFEYTKETGCSVYRKTKIDTLVYDEEYVHWLERKKIANDADTGDRQLTIPDVSGQSELLFCPDCKSKARLQNGFIWCENDDCGGIYRAK